MLDAAAFQHAPKKSIDYAVMERTTQAALIPADIGWSDVGSWRAVWELSDRDQHGKSVRGHARVPVEQYTLRQTADLRAIDPGA